MFKRYTLSLIPLLGWSHLSSAAGEALVANALEDKQPVTAPALDSSHFVDTLIGLVIVLALMLALAWAVKRFVSMPGIGGKGQVQVLGGVSLGPRERAVLVSVEGQRLLLGVAPGRVQTLHVLDYDSEASPPAEHEGFARQLEKASEEKA